MSSFLQVECALNVGVGSSSDPPEIAGLARFMEHVVSGSRLGKSSQVQYKIT